MSGSRLPFMKKYLTACVWILVCTALIKLASASGNHALLGIKDPLFEFMTRRQMQITASGLEIVCVYLILRRRTDLHGLISVCLLASSFTFYRVVLYLIGYKGPCACLGSLMGWFGISDKLLDWFGMLILAFFLIGSYFFIYSLLLLEGRAESAQSS